jgi:transposase-like protein
MACPNQRLSLRQTDESNAETQQPAHAIRGVMSREAVSLVSGVLHRLPPSRMQLLDTVKMIAYRAEPAMTSVVREALARGDDARSLLRDLFRSATDLVPDLEQQLQRVEVHPMSNPRSNRAIAHVLHVLNESDFTYPGTSLRLVYSLAGTADSLVLVATRRNRTLVEQNPAGQEG